MRRIFRVNKSAQTGFTLVEILVIAPVVIIVLAGVVATIVFSTGSAMRASARAQLQYEVLSALDRIEADIKLSKSFTISNGALHLATFATDRNPFDAERRLINRANCRPADTRITVDEAATYWNLYWITGTTLERYAKYGAGDSVQSNMRHCETNHADIFQQPLTRELLLGGNGTTATVQFAHSDGGIDIRLTATKKVAGEDVSFTGVLFVKSLNTP